MDISTPAKIKSILHEALGKLGTFEQCALLDYPAHPNIGDHLIWLGEISYLTEVMKTKIKYATHLYNFCGEEMEKQIGDAPILLSGGGSLGDLWPYHQNFREQIIARYPNHPIIILPQTIYFADKANLLKAAEIFNSHQKLTLFVRDSYSYEIASQVFHNCQVIKSPDMALQLINTPGISSKVKSEDSILYLCRKDKELNRLTTPDYLGLTNFVIEDWISYKYQPQNEEDQEISDDETECRTGTLADMARITREAWQQGTVVPMEWISDQGRKYCHPYISKLSALYNPNLHSSSGNLIHNLIYKLNQYRYDYRQAYMNRQSQNFMQNGIDQFSRHRLLVTNRLHGHILCILLGIPHVFLPNGYYKNESFYRTWTAQLPFCRFAKEPSEVKAAIQELLELFPN